jgi:hypothetical protein
MKGRRQSSNNDVAQAPPRSGRSKVAMRVAAWARVVAGVALAVAVAAVFFTGAYYGHRLRDGYQGKEYVNTDDGGGCIIGLNCGCVGPSCRYRIP